MVENLDQCRAFFGIIKLDVTGKKLVNYAIAFLL